MASISPTTPYSLLEAMEVQVSRHYEQLCEVVSAPLYELLFNLPCPRFLEESLQVLEPIGDCYVECDGNYLWTYGCTLTPYILPMHVLDRLVLMEIVYQTAKFGANVRLKEHKKGLFPSYPLTIGALTLADFAVALTEIEEISFFKLMMSNFNFQGS